MGSLGTFFATMLVAVTYGWMPASSDGTGESALSESASSSNGYEYLVQVGPEDLRALAEGRVSSLSSATPEGMKSIDRVRIVFGEGTLPRQLTAVDRTSPKRLSQTASSQERHTVAKPIVSDWLPARSDETGQRHTVYQRPGYQNPGSLGDAMQRGFQEGTQQITDAVRNAPQSVGNYTNQTARDLAQGTRGVVEGALGGLNDSVRAGADGLRNSANNAANMGNREYFNQRQQDRQQGSQPNRTAAGTQQPGFTPFSYDKQPTLADSQNSHAGHDHAGHDHAGHNHQPSTNLDRQPADNRNRGPALPPASGRSATDNGIATQFGSGANDDPGYRRNEADRGYNNDYRNNDYRNDDRRNDVDRNYENRDTYVNRRDEGRMTPVARDSNLRGPLDDFGTRRDDTYRNPARNAFDDWRAPTADTRRPAAPDFSAPNSWDTPPLNPQQPVNQTAGFGTPNTNQAASPEVASWGGGTNTNYNANPNANPNGGFANNGANNGVNNSANNGGQQSASLANPANDLLFFLLLAGSLAGNLYVVTSYLDVRNKYRSALRQGPSGYRNAA